MPLQTRLLTMVQNHFVLFMGGVLICILLMFFILPAEKKLDRVQQKIDQYEQTIQQKRTAQNMLDQKLESLRKAQTQRKKGLSQLQSQLASLQSSFGEYKLFSLPEIGPFPQSHRALPRTLRTMASKQGLGNIAVKLLLEDYVPNSRTIDVEVTAAAALKNMRRYFISLLETPYVDRINHFQLSTCKDGICLNIQFSVIL